MFVNEWKVIKMVIKLNKLNYSLNIIFIWQKQALEISYLNVLANRNSILPEILEQLCK